MTDVFISYARADRNRVRLIAHALTAEGFSVWWDPEIKPGAQWNAAIRKALEGAACVVTCWSKKSTKSQWVVAETTHGNGRGALVPLLIQDCEPPIPFNMMQAADLSRWRGDGSDPVWIAALEEIRRLVEAKRRLAAAAPPPGEAHGATRVGAMVDDFAGEAFRYTPAPSRMGPRLLPLLTGAVVVTAVLTGGLWLAPQVAERFAPPPMEQAQAPVAPSPQIAPSATAVAPPTPTPEAPAPEASPPPTIPAPTTPATASPPPPSPATAAPAPQTSAPPPQVVDATRELDVCVNRLVALCPNANGQPEGFAADARIAAPERGFLDRLQIASTSPASAEAAQACQGVFERRSTAPRSRRTTLFDQACGAVAFPARPQQTPQIPREVIEAIPEILNRDDDDDVSPNSTQSPTRGQTASPRTGRFVLNRNQWVDFATSRTSADGGDLVLTSQRSGAVLSAGQSAQVALSPNGALSLDACRQASYTASISVERLRASPAFCVRRTDGMVVAAQVTDPNLENFTISYTAWPG